MKKGVIPLMISLLLSIHAGLPYSLSAQTADSIPYLTSKNAKWEFHIQMDFPENTLNRFRAYLIADTAELAAPLKGYFVRLNPEGPGRHIELCKQDETAIQTLISGNTDHSGADTLHRQVKVTRDIFGRWELYTSPDSNGYSLEGTAIDAEIIQGGHSGLLAMYPGAASGYLRFEGFEVTYTSAYTPEQGDLVFNEILADINPAPAGIPGKKFVEIRNISGRTVYLKNLILTDGGVSGEIENRPLDAGAYLILCAKGDTAEWSAFGPTAGVTHFNSLITVSGGAITLQDPGGLMIDSVNYHQGWYRDEEKSDGGWSLELAMPESDCPPELRWAASADESGGTPGKVNSLDFSDDPLALTHDTLAEGQVVQLLFNRLPDPAGYGNLSNFSIDNGAEIELIEAGDGDTLFVHFAEPLQKGVEYSLSITGLEDCFGNTLPDTGLELYLPEDPPEGGPGDLIFNEIMADINPTPAGLPDKEFVEIYNTTEETFYLRDWSLNDGDQTGHIQEETTIEPKGYLILCSTGDTTEFSAFGPTTGVTNFSNLITVNGNDLVLRNAVNRVIDSLTYHPGWYHDDEKSSGGWSMELAMPESGCPPELRWAASLDEAGGTPGRKNSLDFSETPLELIYHDLTVTADGLLLLFNRLPDPGSYSDLSNFSIGNGAEIERIGTGGDTLIVHFAGPLQKGQEYLFNISGLEDCFGNMLPDTELELYLPEDILEQDIVINEILFDPFEGREGFPDGVDFVEIYNRSEKILDLRQLRAALLRTSGNHVIRPVTSESYLFHPGEYMALTSAPEVLKAQGYPIEDPDAFMQIAGFPDYPKTSGRAALLRAGDDLIIDDFEYDEDMHTPIIGGTQGYSLEKVHPDYPAGDPGAFRTAPSSYKATPGYKNVRQPGEETGSGEGITLLNPTFSPDQDGYEDILQIRYQFQEPGLYANIHIYDDNGTLIRKLVRNELLAQEGTITWNGLDQGNGNLPIGIYIIWFEAFSDSGTVKRYKKACVLARKN